MQKIKTYFGQNLKKIRKSKKFSQEYLSEKIGIDRRQLTRIETGKSFPSFGTLDRLCAALNVEPHELFYFENIIPNFIVDKNQPINNNELIIDKIINKIKIYEYDLNKLKFIQTALLCLENKSYIEKLQNILTGMLL